MASAPQRPQLNVDMRLEEAPIRMPVTSKKRRLRYALLDEDDVSSEEEDNNDVVEGAHDQQQQQAGQDSTERPRLSQQQNDGEQFILPCHHDASSSSESDSDEDEDKHHGRALMQNYFSSLAEQPQYENEDDLFDEAFGAPEKHTAQQQSRYDSSTWETKHHAEQDDDDYPSLNQPSQLHREVGHDVVDLCVSDNDDEDQQDFGNVEYRATFQGLRTQQKSPRFSATCRSVFSPNTRPPQPEPTIPQGDDDDIVEYWSSEDEGDKKPRAARRVTNVQEHSISQHNSHWNARRDATFAPARLSHNVARRSISQNENVDNDEEPPFMPAPTRRNPLNRFKAETTDRRRRLRDATTGIHTAASIMLRNSNGPLEQVDDNVWYRQSTAATTSMSRNDLTGGSGVGAGNYTFTAGQSFQQSFQQPVNTIASSNKGRKKQATKKPAAKKGGGKKRGWGGKKNYYRKKGGGGKGKSSRGRNRGGANKRSAQGSNDEYSREDPLLKNVGGANIIF